MKFPLEAIGIGGNLVINGRFSYRQIIENH